MAKNINSLQLLRNTKQLFADKAAAIAGIQSEPTNDGTIKLARYEDNGEVKTIFGIYSIGSKISGSSVSGGSYTIYDSPQEVITALEGRIEANKTAIGVLNGVDTVEGSVAKKIKDAIAGLNATIDSTGGTFVGVKVVETDGKITGVTVKENNIASATLLGNTGDTSDKATAFGYIAKEAADRAAAIEALDVPEVGGTGKVITTISEADGKISATAIDLTAGNVAATASEGDDSHVAVEGTTVAAQIESLAKSVKTTATAKTYSISAVTPSATNVKEEYALVDGGGVQAGSTIKIYKDSSLKGVALDGQTLNFTYILADGSESTVGVDVSVFLAESEFKNGLEVVDHVVNVKVDAASESFLTVGADGVKLSGVQNAIDQAAAKATTKVEKDSNASHITLSSATASDGSVTYTIGQDNIASDTDLKAEIVRAKAAEDKIEASVGLAADGSHVTTTGNYTNAATTVVGEIAALDTQVKANADAIAANKTAIETALASEAAARKAVDGQSGDTYAANTAATYISAATSLNDADVKLDAAIKSVAATAAGAYTEVKVKADGHVKVAVAKSEDGTHDVVTVSESDIASESATTAAINAEKTARETEDAKIVAGVGFSTGDTYLIAANTGAGASVTAASTVKDAIYTLDDAIAAAKKANTLVEGDKTVVVEKVASGDNEGKTSVRVNIASAETVTNFVGYAADGSFIKSAMFGTIDAGTY